MQVSDENEEDFVPIADRIKMSEMGHSEVLHTDADFVPQPLEELYDEISPTSATVRVIRASSNSTQTLGSYRSSSSNSTSL